MAGGSGRGVVTTHLRGMDEWFKASMSGHAVIVHAVKDAELDHDAPCQCQFAGNAETILVACDT